jgi:flavin reductase (DIM6/NTAB) family NADH-FMN oxidoreductase RutF
VFYRTSEPHGLKHNPLNALVIPRPIAWVSTMDADGRLNLAPYSFFNALAYSPPQLMFAVNGVQPPDGRMKDTVANILATGEFVVNFSTWDLREEMNLTSAPAPHDVDEFALAGLTPAPSRLVKVPYVKESPVQFECRHIQTIQLLSTNPEQPNRMVLGEILGIRIDDAVIEDGMVRYDRLRPIGRLGYFDYARVTEVFSIKRPGWPLKPG